MVGFVGRPETGGGAGHVRRCLSGERRCYLYARIGATAEVGLNGRRPISSNVWESNSRASTQATTPGAICI